MFSIRFPSAACRNFPPSRFFPEDLADVPAAQIVCMSCEHQAACLEGALARREQYGIWGGVDFERSASSVRRAAGLLERGNLLEFSAAVEDLVDETSERAGAKERDLQPEHACRRCGARVREGRWPKDEASANAACGNVSTYNRGCRCDPCVDAKSEYQRAG